MYIDLNTKTILITGGTGSLGKIFIKRILKKYPKVGKIIVFSRDEYKQSVLAGEYSSGSVEFVIGDVRDKERLNEVFNGIDIVIHAAAMKCLDVCERNPEETFKTNVIGTNNVIEAAVSNSVEKVIFISTDKAVDPISVYGKSKLQAEQDVIKAAEGRTTEFSVLRLGNIFNSRGSVFSVFEKQASKNALTIYDKRSTRYLIKSKQLFKSILHAIDNPLGGVVLIPKLKIFKVVELAETYCTQCTLVEKPVRKGERVHEFLFSLKELDFCYEDEYYYYIIKDKKASATLIDKLKIFKTPINRPLSSESGTFFSKQELRKLILGK